MGSSGSQTIQLSNTGATSIRLTSAQASGQGFALSGLSLPLTLTAGTNTTFTANFTPVATGQVSGAIAIGTNSNGSGLVIALSGTGAAPGSGNRNGGLEVTPSSVQFGNVAVGSTNSQTLRLSNTGRTDARISSVKTTGTGFSSANISAPLTLRAGASNTFTAFFKPTSIRSESGSISIQSSMSNAPLTIGLSGSGESPSARLTASPTSLNFGQVKIGTPASQPVTLTNSGNTDVRVSSVSVSGAGFGRSGGSGVTLLPRQSITVDISFESKTAGNAAGTLFVSSNAPGSPLRVGLSADAVQQLKQHTVTLSWEASKSPSVLGYFVYRGSDSTGPFKRLNTSSDSATRFVDNTVQAGQKYVYVVTSLGSDHLESVFSAPVSVTIP